MHSATNELAVHGGEADLLDIDALARWLDRHHVGAGEVSDLTRIAGGTQNLMYSFTRGGEKLVLRRGPTTPRPQSNDVLRREMRLLKALNGSSVRHPSFLFGSESGDDVCASVFYVMENVDGFNAAEEVSEKARDSPEHRHRMGLSLASSLGELARVDPGEIGLGDFGKPSGFLERQVPRWASELDKYKTMDGYVPVGHDEFREIGRWLEDNLPESNTVGIIHGDYHLANVIFSWDEPEVLAIVDWEMATLGDPLMDLGWLLAFWPTADGEPDLLGSELSTLGGLPSADEMVDEYVSRSGIYIEDIGWHTVMGCFKAGIVLEGTYARACAGHAKEAVGRRLHGISIALRERALGHIDS